MLRKKVKHSRQHVTMAFARRFPRASKSSLLKPAIVGGGEVAEEAPPDLPPPAGTPPPDGEETPRLCGYGEAAPASPEPVPEVRWPNAGVRVAVGVEHLAHTLRLGETGVSQGPAPDDPLDVIVKLDTAGVLASLRIP